jgi:hypothetical protein
MKQSINAKSSQSRYFTMFLAFALVIGSIPFLAACSQVTPSDTSVSTSIAPSISSVDSNVDSQTSSAIQDASVIASTTVSLLPVETALSLEGYGSAGAANDDNMSIADMLMYAIQDEYVAHGEYVKIIALFGNVNPYVNIANSEVSHISYLANIYAAYGLDLPKDDSAGLLVAPKDLLEAAKTGVQAEITNIAMYENFMTYALPQDILSVFTVLKTASESHLSAFEKQVDKLS